MNRRTLLRLLGGAAIPASLGLAPDALLAAGRKLGSLGAVPAGPLPPFNAHQRATVATLAEAILPATDTPGATAARVDEYIALLLNEWYPAESRTAFMTRPRRVRCPKRARVPQSVHRAAGLPIASSSSRPSIPNRASHARPARPSRSSSG